MPEPIIELRRIVKQFPGVLANDDISLAVYPGEVFALLGENGAGKSTLASLLFGIYQPDSGQIILRGRPEAIQSPARAAELSIGMVHQHFKLAYEYSVTENIILGHEPTRRLAGLVPIVDLARARDEVEGLIDRYGFDLDSQALAGDLPVAGKQRVEILKMLYCDAEILIFDEPTAMLAPQEVDRLLLIIERLRDAGKTIILISHKLEEVARVADRSAVLSRGRLVGVFDVGSTSTQEMASAVLGRQAVLGLEKQPACFGDVVLEARGLTVDDHLGVRRVDSVDICIRQGEVFALAGVAGNGQVELADALAGLIPMGGQVSLNGLDITRYGARGRLEAGLAYIPEDRQAVGLVMDFPVHQNLVLKRYYQPPFSRRMLLDRAAGLAYAEELIERYDIRSNSGAGAVTRSLSGGNQQKLVFSREVDWDFELLVLVQPTRGLDIGASLDVHRRILAERDRGKAVLLVSLELDEVLALADTIGVVFGGKVRKVAPASEVGLAELGEYMTGVRQ